MEPEKIHSIIFDSISDGVFTTDPECRITSFNKAAETVSGFTREEAVGKYCFDIFRTDLCQRVCALRSTLKEHTPVNNERVTIMTKTGNKIPVSVSTTILRDEKGNFVGAVEFFRDMSEVEGLKRQIDVNKKLGDIVSNNEKMLRIFDILPEIARSESSVLIQGPSGSGKELFAQAIHNLSPRANGPYIRLNCAALPEPLLESELFGYVKGAFTDAKRDKPGHFLLAQGGTLLLDEISEMPMSLQVKLLRVLNNGEFQPLGATRVSYTDARIIASSNRDIEAIIAKGVFREDLFYRINVINITVPPLKERLEDLPALIEHFIRRLQRRTGKNIQKVSDEALNLLRQYDFPGNVRELENAVEHAFVLCRNAVIEIEHLPEKIVETVRNGRKEHTRTQPYGESSEAAVITETLRRHNGSREAAARELGMHRGTLWRKMRKYNISQA
ncbi:MAG: sigma 54-interacting transcriptional regulator [bacterium]